MRRENEVTDIKNHFFSIYYKKLIQKIFDSHIFRLYLHNIKKKMLIT